MFAPYTGNWDAFAARVMLFERLNYKIPSELGRKNKYYSEQKIPLIFHPKQYIFLNLPMNLGFHWEIYEKAFKNPPNPSLKTKGFLKN
jgi:hypothetical protein